MFHATERKGRDDWVSTCRSFEVTGPNSRDIHKKAWDDCVGSGALLEGIVQPVPAWKNGR